MEIYKSNNYFDGYELHHQSMVFFGIGFINGFSELIVNKLACIIALSVDSKYQYAKEKSINQNEAYPCRTV